MFHYINKAEIFYLLNWRAQSGDTEKMIDFLKRHSIDPLFNTVIQFKNYINDPKSYSMPRTNRLSRTEKNHLVFDAFFISEKSEFIKLNQELDKLIEQYRLADYCISRIVSSVGKFAVEHPFMLFSTLLYLFPISAAAAVTVQTQGALTNVLDDAAPPDIDPASIAAASLFCEQKLKILQHHSPLKQWGKNYKIMADDRITTIEPSQKNIDYALKECNQALQELLQEESIFPHLLTSYLYIVLAPATLFHGGSSSNIGRFSPSANQIAIVYQPEYNREHYKQALRNELLPQQVMEKNLKKGISKKLSQECSLFSNPSGEIDQIKLKKFERAINLAKDTIDEYKQLLLKTSLSDQETQKINRLLQIVGAYTPKIFSESPEFLKTAIQYNVVTTPDQQGRFQTTDYFAQLVPHLPRSYGQKHGDRVTYSHCPDRTTPIHIAACLIGDLSQQIDAINNPKGPYSKKSKEKKLDEMVSFFVELPAVIQKGLTPDLYQILCEFFTEDTAASIPISPSN